MIQALSFIFLLSSFTLQAQIRRIDTISNESIKLKTREYETVQLYAYSIGIKFYSLEEFPKILNQTNTNKLIHTVTNGVFVKFNDNQLSYRIAGNYYTKDISFKNECEECEEAKGNLKDFSTSIGFEKNFIYGVIQPYFAFDLGYRRNTFEGTVTNATAVNYTTPYDVTTLKNGFLMSPNFGIKLNPTNHISIAIETGVNTLYNYEKQERTYQDASRSRTVNQYKKWEFLLKPISLISLQYNFGLMY